MRQQTRSQIEDIVFARYIDTGDSTTIPEVVRLVSFGETTVREAVQTSSRVTLTTKLVPIMSKSYPGTIHQYRTVEAYEPTKLWLRLCIKGLGAVSDLHPPVRMRR